MTISIDDCYRAFEARDPAYDGRFYVAVVTTGVYCRPTCSGRPKRENVRFYDTAAEARGAGFRACKRCKPGA
jgi:methylphosphotriester-DNA--protein-cysteine methyltransferase